MRMYAHLLRNTCKVLFVLCHLSSCVLPPPQGLHHGQTHINLLFNIGWVCHEHSSLQSESVAFQTQPSWMKAVFFEDC